VPGLGTSFGRGGATTAQWDLANADCITIMGSNMAENHPIAFRFVLQAKARGARVIHIDPRFSRTSALADLHLAIRPGTDIAFLGGLINYVIEHERYFKEYVEAYTNASFLVGPDFRDTEDLDGLFSGFDPERGVYALNSWQYLGTAEPGERDAFTGESHAHYAGHLDHWPPPRDRTLQDPRCVFQILKRHFARYTPELVEEVCGVPRAQFLAAAEAIAAASGRERTGAWCYAVGWTQHTTGVQMIRACAILQLLLGNIGRPGGGILALRGHATIQGSTDVPTLYNLLPGYIPMPDARKERSGFQAFLEDNTAALGWWHNFPKYLVSLLKAWYGGAASRENDWGFDFLPRIVDDHSQLPMTLAMKDGKIEGLFLMGQNPAVGGHNASLVRTALANLDWLVVRDMYETETAAFWYRSPEVEAGALDPAAIKTEVFFLPAAVTGEKEGSYTNTHRLIQFHEKAVEPPGDARSETWFMYHLGRRLKALYAGSTEPRDRPFQALTWDYPTHGRDTDPSSAAILKEINGYTVADGRPVAGYADLKDDGSTACGVWIYSGVLPKEGLNLAAARVPDPEGAPGSHQGWGFAWPDNRRILYNRAAADPAGKPWSERKRYLWWDAAGQRWTGLDTPDFPSAKPPDYAPPPGARGVDAHPGTAPFLMNADGMGWLFAPAGLKDGPLPAHYEPLESPVTNPLYAQQTNPVAKRFERPDNPLHRVNDPRFPYVVTTYRLTEHHTGGTMTRFLPWLAELQPEMFVEISPELAAEKGIRNGDWVTVRTLRGEVEGKALVTGRMRPQQLGRRTVHTVGLPWHYGYMGLARGDTANTLSAIVGDPNTTIHEGKVFTCDLRRGRRTQTR
jgi:formate dehydrogenase major subunit